MEPKKADDLSRTLPIRQSSWHRGTRVKIRDGGCRGLPAVSTSIGAERILVQNGENMLLANSGVRLCHGAVVRIAQDSPGLQRVRTEGRRLVERRYDWRRIHGA